MIAGDAEFPVFRIRGYLSSKTVTNDIPADLALVETEGVSVRFKPAWDA